MSIGAHKLGKMGSTLSVIAETFQATSNQVLERYKDFSERTTLVLSDLKYLLAELGCVSLQTEMMSFYLTEILNKKNHDDLIKSYKEFAFLLNASQSYFEIVSKKIKKYYKEIKKINLILFEIQTLFTKLDLISAGGQLEGSRTNETINVFRPFLSNMKNIVETVIQPTLKMSDEIKKIETYISGIVLGTAGIEHSYEDLKTRDQCIKIILSIKEEEQSLDSIVQKESKSKFRAVV